MWDAWMVSLSDSYAKVLDELSAGRQKEAAAEFRGHFLQTVKKLYTEASQTYPTRFSKINDWCAWARGLYTLTMQADRALAASSPDAPKLIESLRQHFYALHKETDTLSVSDAIYAFRVEAAATSPSIERLKSLRQAVSTARPSVKSRLDNAAFTTAQAKWAKTVDAALQQASLAPADLRTLREATETFYRGYGVQME